MFFLNQKKTSKKNFFFKNKLRFFIYITIQAYMSLARHMRKGRLRRWIIASPLCRAVDCQQFCKESRKRQTKIMFERYYSIFCHRLLSCRYVSFQKQYFE